MHLALSSPAVLEAFERAEASAPSRSKRRHGRTVVQARALAPTRDVAPAVLCGLGAARDGGCTYRDDRPVGPHAAPEVVLGAEWGSEVDVWSVGVLVRSSPTQV